MYVNLISTFFNSDEELDNLISECSGLLGSEKGNAKKWSDRMEELHSVWEEHRSSIVETMLQHESVAESTLCSNCDEHPGLIRCHQCGDNWPMCFKCDKTVDQDKPFHDRQGWFENHFRPLQPLQSLDENGLVIDVGMSMLECHMLY